MVNISDELKIVVPVEVDASRVAQTKFQSSLNNLVDKLNKKGIPKISVKVSKINGKEAIAIFKKEIEKVIGSINQAGSAGSNGQSPLKKQIEESSKAAKQLAKLQKEFDKILSSAELQNDTNSTIAGLQADFDKLGENANGLTDPLNKVKQSYKELHNAIKEYNKLDEKDQKDDQKEKIVQLSKEYKNATDRCKELVAIQKKQTQAKFTSAKDANDLKDLIDSLEKYGKINDRLHQDSKLDFNYTDLLERARSTLSGNNFNSADVKELRSEFRGLAIDVRAAGLEGQTFGTRFKAQLEKLGVYFSAATIMTGSLVQIKKMIENVSELDKVVTDLQIATGYTRNETRELLNTYSEMARQLGATSADVAKSADTWLRQGYAIDETNTLIKNSLILSKLGQIDSEAATKALTSSMKGYNISVEDSIGIVDKFTAVDREAAVSAGYIATALAETATSARLAGVDLNKVTGYIAAIGETTQDGPESVGNFAKTLFARMGNIKAGNLFDPESSESLSDVETVLSGLGIKLRESSGEFRNFGEVLDEVAGKWNSYGTVNQRAIAVAFSG